VVLVALGSAGAWLLLGSGTFDVRVVQVAGTDRLAPAAVLEAAAVDRAQPLARVDTEAVARRVRQLPAVRDVAVVRRWPGAVEIAVRERQPVAVRRAGTSFLLIDSQGVAFEKVRKRPKELSLISGTGGVDSMGRVRTLDPRTLRAALTVLGDLPPGLRRAVREVRAADPEDVTLRLSRRRVVMWGSPDRGPRKAAVLAALVTRKARVYDVSAPDTPTTRK